MKKSEIIDIKAILKRTRGKFSSYRVIFAIFLVLIAIIALQAYLSISRERAAMIEATIREKRTLTELVALSVASAEIYTVPAHKRQIVEEVTKHRDILYCRIVKPTGEIYMSNIQEDLGKLIKDPAILTDRTVVKNDVYDGRRIKVIVSPTARGYTVWLGFSLDEVEAAVRRMILSNLGMAACITIACIVVYSGLTNINQRLMATNLALEKAYRDLKDSQAQLIQASKLAAIGRLTAGIAHELNNPLTAVLGYAQLLQAAELDERVKADLDKIVQGAERTAHIVRNLLTFARQQKPKRHLVNINDVLLSILDLQAYHLKVENIEVVKELARDLPPTVADPSQLSQVFLNLISNAQQAMVEAHGGGTLTVRSKLVNGGIIRVEIADDGPGIPLEILERIFDPFFTTKEVGQGTGLGLSICYGIVQEHGGHIWAESEPGQGATFFVELPVIEESLAEAVASAQTKQPVVKRKRILIVEDEESIVTLLRRTLEEKGHRVDAVASGEEAFMMLEGGQYDLLISDLKRPGIDGRQLYEHLMATHPELGQRMVFITGDMLSPETQAFLTKVGNPYLSKPFNLASVEEIVIKAFSK